MNRGFWNGKSIFLTGHTGFKGGWLSLCLQRLGASISGYALEPAGDICLYEKARIGEGIRSTLGDVRDGESLRRAMEESQPEIAFHLAAQPLVRASYNDPAATYAVNVMGTVNFLEAVRRTPSVRVAIVVTSDKCYENREWWWGYREDEPMGGSDPYSSSKGCAELVTSAYRRSYFNDGRVAVASVRAGNVIGGGDWAADRLIPDLVRAFSAKAPLYLRFPHAVRPWQHVLEPLRGYLTLAERLWHEGTACAGGWNFGPRDDDAWTVLDVVRHAATLWGEGASWRVDHEPHPHEARYLKLDCTLARSRLGWVPVLDLAKALEWTVAWYHAHQDNHPDMRTFTTNQIERYEALFTATALEMLPPHELIIFESNSTHIRATS